VLTCEVIIPVPLHPDRRRERGFNQAEMIARVITSAFDITLDTGSFIRIRHTERHRAGMDSVDRSRSVEKAFKVTKPRLIDGASILLVDDLYTTGSTMRTAAKTLLEAGAKRVSLFTVARVPAYGSIFSLVAKTGIHS